MTASWRAHSRIPAADESGHGGSPRSRTRPPSACPRGPVEELRSRPRRRLEKALGGIDVDRIGVVAERIEQSVGVRALDAREDRLLGADPVACKRNGGFQEILLGVVDLSLVYKAPRRHGDPSLTLAGTPECADRHPGKYSSQGMPIAAPSSQNAGFSAKWFPTTAVPFQ